MLKFLKMAPKSPTPKKVGTGKQSAQPPSYRSYPPASPPEVVDPIWLLKAIGVVIVAALVCGYGSLCFLLYQGQWQLILHPKQNSSVPATIGGTPVELVHFGTDESARPQLTGWVIPAAAGARYAGFTLLFLPPGDGSLSDSTPSLTILHNAGINIFAVDYRGYGQSAATHPNQVRMTQDVESAFQYLVDSRRTRESQVIPFGSGVGASLAVHLAAEHPGVPAIVLTSPGADPLETILQDPRTQFLPVRVLIHDRFALAGPLASLKTPKLLIQPEKDDQAFRGAADPKVVVSAMPALSSPEYGPVLTQYFIGFLDQSLRSNAIPQLLHPPN